jgi:hypothetical protein
LNAPYICLPQPWAELSLMLIETKQESLRLKIFESYCYQLRLAHTNLQSCGD